MVPATPERLCEKQREKQGACCRHLAPSTVVTIGCSQAYYMMQETSPLQIMHVDSPKSRRNTRLTTTRYSLKTQAIWTLNGAERAHLCCLFLLSAAFLKPRPTRRGGDGTGWVVKTCHTIVTALWKPTSAGVSPPAQNSHSRKAHWHLCDT